MSIFLAESSAFNADITSILFPVEKLLTPLLRSAASQDTK